MKKILVIGGAGYIGAALIEVLLKNKFKVVSIDNNLYKNQSSLNDFKKNKDFKFFNADFSNKKLLSKLFQEGYKNIIFLAALVGDPISKKYPVCLSIDCPPISTSI